MKKYEKPEIVLEGIILDDVIATSSKTKTFGDVNDNSMSLDFSDFII